MKRRDFLNAALLAPLFARLRLQSPRGERLGLVPFLSRGAAPAPLERLLGDGLDARLFVDLSAVTPARLVTPAEGFFIRTAAARTLPPASGWTIAIGGLVREPATLDMPSLERLAHGGGRYLIECAGNADPANYGLMSVADWEGVPLLDVLDLLQPSSSSYRVLVSGFDDESAQPRTSVPGASWIFARDDLRRALLALRMNGAPLAPHHGAPVRLVVPGWYGCACIKWVNRIELVPDDAKATSQMWEFAHRTHQNGAPPLARDYIPASVDTAATPIRIERWSVDGRIEYRVIGIVWGGEKPTNSLAIRFRTSEPWVPVESCPLPASTLTWSVWTHTWKPDAPGKYEIVVKVTDPAIRTRRLDLFYYVREVRIDEIASGPL